MPIIPKVYSYFVLLAVLMLFPFGQLLRFDFNIYGDVFKIHPIDCAVLMSLPFLFVPTKSKALNRLIDVIFIFVFSFLLSISIFQLKLLATGFLHLIRVISYYSLARMVNISFYRYQENSKNLFLNLRDKLLIVLFISLSVFLLFGYAQYIIFPDLTALKYIGWDDHLNRFVSTMLDPAFTGAILVVGFFLTLWVVKNKYVKYAFSFMFILGTFLTYSRASYLSLFIPILTIFRRKWTKTAILLLTLVLGFTLITRKSGEGVNLLRVFSIELRIKNYRESIKAFLEYPLFGIGFNNICQYRIDKNLSKEDSHACSGSDNSYLLVLATTGIVGILVGIGFLYTLVFNNFISRPINLQLDFPQSDDIYYYRAIILSLAVGALFNNILFYNFLMVIEAIIMGMSHETTRKNIQ